MPPTSENQPHHPPPEIPPQNLWAPWRLEYLESIPEEPSPAAAPPEDDPGSFLTEYWNAPEHDTRNHVLHRSPEGMILLNAYPYANGHLLVALGEARPRLLDYDPAQRAALWSLVDLASGMMERALTPQGINIGINQGRAAGAGVPSHLHAHLVPRWSGDVNFITTVGRVRVIPSALEQMAERYRSTSTN